MFNQIENLDHRILPETIGSCKRLRQFLEVISLSHIYLGLLAVPEIEIQTEKKLSDGRLPCVADFRSLEGLVWVGEVTLQRPSLADVGHVRGAHMMIVLGHGPPNGRGCLQ
jgi:hypothetical protein